MTQNPKTIVVFNHRHIGDLLGSFPALLAMREKWPDARVVNVAPPLPLSLLQNSPLSDVLVAHPKDLRGTMRAFLQIRREKPDLAICFSGSRRVAVMARFSGAKTRAGFSPTKHEWAWTLKMPKKGPPALQHDLKMAEMIGCAPRKRDYVGLLHLTGAERDAAARWMRENGVSEDEKLIAINMGASVARRQWGVSNFAAVARELGQNGHLVAFGGPGDLASIEELKKAVDTPILVAAGEFSPRESAALMNRCAVMITGDTGPMHLALCVNTPTVALFGLVPASYRLPVGTSHIGLEHNEECQQLKQPKCRYADSCACLGAITPAEVVAGVQILLQSTAQAHF